MCKPSHIISTKSSKNGTIENLGQMLTRPSGYKNWMDRVEGVVNVGGCQLATRATCQIHLQMLRENNNYKTAICKHKFGVKVAKKW